jgi:ornithine lipid hydroxylase
VIPARAEWSALTDRQSLNDLGHAIVANLIGERLGELIILTLAASAAGGLSTLVGGSVWPSHWPPFAQIGLVVFVGDGLDYWKHRRLHTVPGLWRVHALHHGITQLHALKAAPLHFTDLLMRFLLVYAPLVVLGAPARIIFWYTAFIGILGVIGHSNTRPRVPSVVHRLLMTPQVHSLHHSVDRRLSDSNYANVFPVWDIVFGTYSDPGRHAPGAVGVRDDPLPEGFVAQLLSPFTWPRLVKEAGRPA